MLRPMAIGAFLLAGLTLTLLVAPGAGALVSLPARVTFVALAATTLCAWLAVAILRPAWLPSTRLWPAFAAVLVAYAVATATSRIPRLSIEMLGYAILLVGLYLFLVAVLRRPELRIRLERYVLVILMVALVAYPIQVLSLWSGWWDLVGGAAVPPMRPLYVGLAFGSPNPLATLVLILCPFVLATATHGGQGGRALRATIVVLVAAVVFVTTSRGAWAGAAAAVLVTGVAVTVTGPGGGAAAVRDRLRTPAGKRLTALAGVVAVVALAAVAATGRLSLDDGGARAGFSTASLRMVASSPITGVGPGLWPVLRAPYSDATAPDQYIPHAHNIYLQTAAEFGAIGIIAGLICAIALGRLLAGAIRSGDAARRGVGLAALFGVTVLAVQQLVDVLVNVPALLVALAIPIAWLDAAALPPPPRASASAPARRDRRPALLAGLGIIVVAGTTAGLMRIESIAGTAAAAAQAADRGHWVAAQALAEDVLTADPDIPPYSFALGIAAANSGDLRAAEPALEAAALADDYPYAWLDLAAVRWSLGDEAGARDALVRAERMGLQRIPIAVAAGWLRDRLGDHEEAVRAYALAVTASPALAADPFWRGPDGPVAGFDAVLAVVDERAGAGTRLQVALALDQEETATALAADLRATDPALYELVVPAATGDEGAWQDLQALVSQRPTHPETLRWGRFVAGLRGDDAASQRIGQMEAVLGGPDAATEPFGRVTLGDARSLPHGGLDSYASTYRRELPAAHIVAILPQVQPGWSR